jgi:hypothetical protein
MLNDPGVPGGPNPSPRLGFRGIHLTPTDHFVQRSARTGSPISQVKMRTGCYTAAAVALAVAACLPTPSHGLGGIVGGAMPIPRSGLAHPSGLGPLKTKPLNGLRGGGGSFKFDMVAANLREMWAQPALFGEEAGYDAQRIPYPSNAAFASNEQRELSSHYLAAMSTSVATFCAAHSTTHMTRTGSCTPLARASRISRA